MPDSLARRKAAVRRRADETRKYILRSRNRNATVATKLQTISSPHRSSQKSLVGRTSMNQRGLLSIGRIWSSLSRSLPRSADRENLNGEEAGETLFVGFRGGGEGKARKRDKEREREQCRFGGHLKIDRNLFTTGGSCRGWMPRIS